MIDYFDLLVVRRKGHVNVKNYLVCTWIGAFHWHPYFPGSGREVNRQFIVSLKQPQTDATGSL